MSVLEDTLSVKKQLQIVCYTQLLQLISDGQHWLWVFLVCEFSPKYFSVKLNQRRSSAAIISVEGGSEVAPKWKGLKEKPKRPRIWGGPPLPQWVKIQPRLARSKLIFRRTLWGFFHSGKRTNMKVFPKPAAKKIRNFSEKILVRLSTLPSTCSGEYYEKNLSRKVYRIFTFWNLEQNFFGLWAKNFQQCSQNGIIRV